AMLYLEGKAFDYDADELETAIRRQWTVTARPENNNQEVEEITGLSLVNIDHEIDPRSRALKVYAELPNEIAHRRVVDGHEYLSWRFKPGQWMQMQIPVKEWKKRIVLPVDAVAREGAEYFVFLENGRRFERVPVHVEYRDQFSVVIAHDGSVFPGDRVARRGAHQMQVALKNKAGGAVDPHAGHSH
ncbi:MAG: efflux RND transporter periplasmic adaptor subunit, partial [Planctomycetales bacterium]